VKVVENWYKWQNNGMKNNMSLPKYHETFIPILKVLSDGRAIHYNELRKKVRDEFYSDLPQELLEEKTKSGDILILNRIGWAKAYLKQAELIYQPERAIVQITDKGKDILKKGSLTLQELLHDKDFLANRKTKKSDKDIEEASEDASPQDLIDAGFNKVEQELKLELLTKLQSTDPYDFEIVVNRLLQKMGYGDFKVTSKSGDGGIDGIINQDKLGLEKIYMQAKRYTKNEVGGRDMTNFIGAVARDGVNKGIFVTLTSFSSSARDIAEKVKDRIVLVDGEKLVEMMIQYGVGVQVKSRYDIKQLDEDFFESN
jgi:restriction system protein